MRARRTTTMTCPCRATEYALLENAKRGKRIAELEGCLLTAEERLAQVTRERDEWRDKFHAVNQTAGELCNACGWAFKIPGEPCRCEVVKERDEARAEVERLREALEASGEP